MTDSKYPFRVKNERIETPSEERIKKVAGKKLSEFKYLYAYFTIPFRIRAFPSMWKLVGTIINRFFAIQFLEKWKIIKVPLTNVDHPLDDRVPFEPQRVDIYLDFINLWVRPLAMLLKRYGSHRAIPLVIEWFRYLTKAYYEASKMYLSNMTTTHRPDYREMKQFRLIHRSDPHYLCVPSLHIAIVCLSFSFYRMIFEREGFTKEETAQWNKELYDQAINIAETVLYVKQHSVNCIPAALYMMTKIVPDLFSIADAEIFINNLFLNAPSVKADDREKIIAHIHFTFQKFLLEGADSKEWYEPVLNWVQHYDWEKVREEYLAKENM